MSEDTFLARLALLVGADHVITEPDALAPFNTDRRGKYPGRARAVVRPADTGQVSEVVRACAQAGIAIVPQGGNTGLAGASTADDSGREVVLNLTRMNRIRSINADDNAITVEAGCILHDVQTAAAAHDRLFPLSLAAEGSATIGGNLSTNAGGEQVLRYGNTRDLALGLEVVMPDGRIWHGLSPLRKDNTGYDLKHLFIGGEGTLGVITAASLKLYPAPHTQYTFWMAVSDPAKAVAMLTLLREALGDRITAFELISDNTLALVRQHFPRLADPLPGAAPWYVLADVSETSPHIQLGDALQGLLADALDRGLLIDVVLAQSTSQAEALWRIRDHVPDAQRHEGPSIKHDVSVPVSGIPRFIERAGPALEAAFPGIRVICFGHVGDGNLHYNLSKPAGQSTEDFWASEDAVHDVVHAIVADMHGSISAEHGVGRIKQDAFLRYEDPVALDAMLAIKQALDPNGLFNPGRMLPRRR